MSHLLFGVMFKVVEDYSVENKKERRNMNNTGLFMLERVDEDGGFTSEIAFFFYSLKVKDQYKILLSGIEKNSIRTLYYSSFSSTMSSHITVRSGVITETVVYME